MANVLKLDMKNHGVQYHMPYLEHLEWFVTNVGKMKHIHGDTVFQVEMMKIVSLKAVCLLLPQFGQIKQPRFLLLQVSHTLE